MVGFEILFPNEESAKFAYFLRQDPAVRKQSITFVHEENFDSFAPRFYDTHFTIASLPPLAILLSGERIGLLRFDRCQKDKWAEVSIVLKEEVRGKGVGTEVIRKVGAYLKGRGFQGASARIKLDNIASQKAFLKAGWSYVEEKEGLQIYRVDYGRKAKRLFFVAEAGSNWKSFSRRSDFEQAAELIDVAKEAGADAIKFQTFRARTTYVSEAGKSRYLQGEPDISGLFEKLEMPYEMIPRLYEKAQKVGIEFMSAVFSKEDLRQVDPYVLRHKVASYENNHFPLLEALALTNKPLFLSTGATCLPEIRKTLAFLREKGVKEITLLQCTAAYPAPPPSINLPVIAAFQEEFGVSVGLSDHSSDPFAAPLGALAFGATVIEKHFTLSRTLEGPDHRFAVEPNELAELITSIRAAEMMYGSWKKEIDPVEEELRKFARRALQATQDIQEGEPLHLGLNYDVLRPGENIRGEDPSEISAFEGKRASRNIRKGEGIS